MGPSIQQVILQIWPDDRGAGEGEGPFDDGLWHDDAYFTGDDGLWHDDPYFTGDTGLWHDNLYF